MSYRDSTKEQAYFGCSVVAWLVVLTVVVLALGFGWLVVRPYFLNQQREGTMQTMEWTITKQQQVMAMKLDYEKLEAQAAYLAQKEGGGADTVRAMRTQQRALLDRMRVELAQMAPNTVPPEVAAFMAGR